MKDLLGSGTRRTELTLVDVPDDAAAELAALAETTQRVGQTLVLDVQGDDAVRKVLERALAGGIRVDSLIPKRETLEDIFVRKAL
jgi:ABC-2 type transport system ATP-binding protein